VLNRPEFCGDSGVWATAILTLPVCRPTRLTEAGVDPSVGSVGDAYDNALAETTPPLSKNDRHRIRQPQKLASVPNPKSQGSPTISVNEILADVSCLHDTPCNFSCTKQVRSCNR
jgi:hypothetical protein